MAEHDGSVLPITLLAVRSLRRRLGLLLAFSLVFMLAALTVRLVAAHDGHVEPDALFQLGGYPLVSAILLLGWTIGRFPVIAVLVLAAGVFSADLASGQARLLAVRPASLARIYGVRLLAQVALAFLLSALLMPAFDLLLLGRWAGPATLVLIAAYVIAYGGLVAFLSVLTRADAWVALALALLSILWATLRSSGFLTGAPALARELITFVLPPQGAFFQLESAFSGVAPIPWGAFAFAAGYGFLFLALSALLIARREL
jgi:hypothetical protein